MKTFLRPLLSALVLATCPTEAAPSVELPLEWAAPLEGGEAMILVETATGQARILRFDGDFQVSELGPVATNLPGVTGLNTALRFDGAEHAIISSTGANAVRFLNLEDLSLTTFQPEVPGPVTAIPMRRSGTPPAIFQLSRYGDQAEVLQRYRGIFSSKPLPEGASTAIYPVFDLQPTFIPGEPDEQAGVVSREISDEVSLFQVRPVKGGVDYDLLDEEGFIGEKLASQCVGSDGRLCVLRYLPGQVRAKIVTLPYSGFSTTSAISNELPFRLGRITAIPPGVPGAPHGVLITSDDGSTAAYAHIEEGKQLSIQATFDTREKNLINGLIPIPGRGLLLLEGPGEKRLSTSWRGFVNARGRWRVAGAGPLSGWLPAQVNFATLFWFNGTPLIDPAAEIIKFETRADWTRKASPGDIPPQIELSELLTAQEGLTPSSVISPTAPPGATFLLTSQREDQVSITAMGPDLDLMTPSLSIAPPSGSYDEALTVSALYDDGANELYYREDLPGRPWQLFEPFTIGYPSSWLFYARSRSTGTAGPIIRRDYQFPGLNPNSLDSDDDGVPDYVERHLGLDPAGGGDSDGDFQSDLEEILAGTNPADPDSNTPPGDPRTPPFLGEGFELAAQAFNAANQGASPANSFSPTTTEDDFPGETLVAHDMFGALLATENVTPLVTPPALAGQSGAFMQIATGVPAAFWITLSSPTNFGVLDVLSPPRTGREIIKVMPRPVNPVAEVVTTPSGTDRNADAQAWITAAQAAHGSHETVSVLTELRPVDNALSALAEQALFDRLQALPDPTPGDLGLPPEVKEFTLFPQRTGESFRTPFSPEMAEALRNEGWDFPAILALLSDAANDPTVIALADEITATHAANSESNPLMALPLDAFRSLIRTGGIVDPAPGDPPRPNPYAGLSPANLTAAKTLFDDLLAQIPDTRREEKQWSLVIAPSSDPLRSYDYLREGTGEKVWLADRFGERQLLEQGLGLAVGSVFTIDGFADIAAPAGFVGFEPIRIESVVTPLASDTDTNANLLDDGWENVFFGDLGVVGPFDPHPVTGHSYLEYQLTGADPRSGSLQGTPATLFPTNMTLVWVPAALAYDLTFNFAPEFLDRFEFTVQSSASLQGFSVNADVGPVTPVAPGTYRIRISTDDSTLPSNFFQIRISLK